MSIRILSVPAAFMYQTPTASPSPSSRSRTVPTVPTLSVTGRPRGCAWYGEFPLESPPGPGRRCGVRSRLLSWFSSCVLPWDHGIFLYRFLCIIRRIWKGIQNRPLVFSGNVDPRRASKAREVRFKSSPCSKSACFQLLKNKFPYFPLQRGEKRPMRNVISFLTQGIAAENGCIIYKQADLCYK